MGDADISPLPALSHFSLITLAGVNIIVSEAIADVLVSSADDTRRGITPCRRRSARFKIFGC